MKDFYSEKWQARKARADEKADYKKIEEAEQDFEESKNPGEGENDNGL